MSNIVQKGFLSGCPDFPSLRDVAGEKEPEVFTPRTPAEDSVRAMLPGDTVPKCPEISPDQVRAFREGLKQQALAESTRPDPCKEVEVKVQVPRILPVQLDKQRRVTPGKGISRSDV